MSEETTVKFYKGNRRMRRGVERMSSDGWTVQTTTSRKMVWRWYCGIFTRSQRHTVTFVKVDPFLIRYG